MNNLIETLSGFAKQYITPTLIFPTLTILVVLLFFVYYWYAVSPRQGSLEWIALRSKNRMTFTAKRHPMTKKDALPLLLVTAVYAATAFFQLGDLTAPQTFCAFPEGGVDFVLKEPVSLSRVMYYTGLGTGDYTLEISEDGATWYTLRAYKVDGNSSNLAFYWSESGLEYHLPTEIKQEDALVFPKQEYSDLFKWIEAGHTPTDPANAAPVRARMFHITASSTSMELGELALYDANGAFITADRVAYADEEAAKLFDEGDTIPETPTWHNSAYFDEIYHARTAYEHIRGVYPYEVSHPPLGKLTLSIGIQLFGMTPFGWRSMGALFGVLMLPVLYVFLKNLFGKTAIALCGTALFAFDFMHLTQTRIATIDTYAVFYIICMYFFMYRYLTLPAGSTFQQGALPLFLSGLSFGLGAASKWTVIYAGAGLAILYFVGLWFKWRDHPTFHEAPKFGPWLVKTLLFSVLAFVLVPGVIYLLSYLPYAAARGGMSLSNLWTQMLENQKFMFTYHVGVTADHPYASRWYQWLVDGRPILYYLDYASVPGSKAAFACFSNPVVCWAGLLSLVILVVQMVRLRCGKALFILVGYLSQLLPWLPIARPTFAYHYFPSTVFLVLAVAFVMNDMMERRRGKWQVAVYGVTGLAAGVYALFYPVLIGLMIPTGYATNLLRWLPSWPF